MGWGGEGLFSRVGWVEVGWGVGWVDVGTLVLVAFGQGKGQRDVLNVCVGVQTPL